MKFQLRLAIAIAIFAITSQFASAEARHDGHLWAALPRDLKISYIQGLIDGSAIGAMMAMEGMPENAAGRNEIVPSYQKTCQKLIAEVSPAQIADGMDSIFKDYRNQSLLMTDAFYVTLRTIAGLPPESVEKLLEKVRRAPKSLP